MEENHLNLLEQRINRAISFIETLKSREKTLTEEKDGLQGKISSLEESVREKDLKIEALKENQLFLKEKIEAVLSKLESLANLEEQSNDDNPEPPEEDESVDDDSTESEIIIEENIVDLKEEEVEHIGDAEVEEESSDDEDDEGGLYNVAPDDTAEYDEDEELPGEESGEDQITENTLFKSEDFGMADEGEAEQKRVDENPFVEM